MGSPFSPGNTPASPPQPEILPQLFLGRHHLPKTNIDGVKRPQGDGIDMGAYEHTGEIVVVEATPSTKR